MVKKMPPIIKFFVVLLVINVLLFGVKLSIKNPNADKCIKNVINDVLKDNISHYENKEKLAKLKQAFNEFEKEGLNYSFHNVVYDENKEVYNVFIGFIKKDENFIPDKHIEISMKLKRKILSYEFVDATIINIK